MNLEGKLEGKAHRANGVEKCQDLGYKSNCTSRGDRTELECTMWAKPQN